MVEWLRDGRCAVMRGNWQQWGITRLRSVLEEATEELACKAYGHRCEIALPLGVVGREDQLVEALQWWWWTCMEKGRCGDHGLACGKMEVGWYGEHLLQVLARGMASAL
ncbi:hypothetical protein EDB83DRAFT_2310698 [Lactarius deliciosus]|nr:hypothetical protein EDB83DRAFT_2310698 [Lactarius deliciosus]